MYSSDSAATVGSLTLMDNTNPQYQVFTYYELVTNANVDIRDLNMG